MEVIDFLVFTILELVFIFGLGYFASRLLGDAEQLPGDEEVDFRRQDAIEETDDFDKADRLIEFIGSYRESRIYRFAVFGDSKYQFDHILLPSDKASGDKRSRCIAPGLVYLPVS